MNTARGFAFDLVLALTLIAGAWWIQLPPGRITAHSLWSASHGCHVSIPEMGAPMVTSKPFPYAYATCPFQSRAVLLEAHKRMTDHVFLVSPGFKTGSSPSSYEEVPPVIVGPMLGINAHIALLPFANMLQMQNPRVQSEEPDDFEDGVELTDAQYRSKPLWYRAKRNFVWATSQVAKAAQMSGLSSPSGAFLLTDRVICDFSMPAWTERNSIVSPGLRRRSIRIPPYEAPRRLVLVYEDLNGKTTSTAFEGRDAACHAMLAAEYNSILYGYTIS